MEAYNFVVASSPTVFRSILLFDFRQSGVKVPVDQSEDHGRSGDGALLPPDLRGGHPRAAGAGEAGEAGPTPATHGIWTQ